MSASRWILDEVELWAVIEDSEKSEGRGPQITIGYAVTEDVALHHSRHKGVMGSDTQPRRVAAFKFTNEHTGDVLYGIRNDMIHGRHLLTVSDEERKSERELALQKLTKYERQLLGLE